MKVKVTLPYGYGRAFLNPEKFVRSAPRFNILAYDNDGNRIQDAYPESVQFGPDMYDLLNRILPRIAARRGEDLNYEGKVEVKPRKAKERYAYYGFGNNPLSLGNTENLGIGFIGFGDTPSPKTNKDNFLYSMKLDAPSPHGSNSRSQVLTNILNDSQDFSPLLAPLYNFTDTKYNEADDLEGKGPRPTDHWVPRVDPVTHQMMLKDDGTPMWIPIPLVQDMPIYNFKHPLWEQDPEAAWNLVHDIDSAFDWQKWNKAPSYADYTGLTSVTNKGDIRPRDYLMHNSRMLDRPGYFEDWPELKKNAREHFRDIKGQRSVEGILDAREEAAKEFEKAHQEKLQQAHNERFYRPDDERHTGLGKQGNYYKTLIHRGLQNTDILEQFKGKLDSGDEKAIKKFIMQPGSFSKYNQQSSDEDKLIAILRDYSDSKDKDNTQSNILSGVKEPF